MKTLMTAVITATLFGSGLNAAAQTAPMPANAPKPGTVTRDEMTRKDGTPPASAADQSMVMRKDMLMGMGMTPTLRRGSMKAMDANGDGMISKDEYMKWHEVRFDRMSKSAMISMKDLDDINK